VTEPSTPTLTRIHVGGYRSLSDVTLEPGRITVLIGPNSVGKSNFLSFLQMLTRFPKGGLSNFVRERGGASNLLHYGPKQTPHVWFRLDLDEGGIRTTYNATLGFTAGERFVFFVEAVSQQAEGQEPEYRKQLDSHDESAFATSAQHWDHPALTRISRWLRRVSVHHFHDTSITSVLRGNSPGGDDRSLGADGYNLAGFLYRLMRSHDPGDQAAWRRIGLLIRRIAPAVADLIPEPVNPNDDEDQPKHVRLRWRDDRGETFGTDALSDGTLRAIALVTALAQPTATLPALLSIDEPELGLHPAALALVADLIRSVSSRCQVVLATQSPALLDYFTAEEVAVVERHEGETKLRRLVPEDLRSWLAEYSLSELYDKNVLGGRP